jgi:hypothetical protein
MKKKMTGGIEEAAEIDEQWIRIAALMYEIGQKANANYVANDGTYTSMDGLRGALQLMGYTYAPNPYYYSFPAIRQSIISQRPVIAAGADTANKGHAWVIDGTRYMVYQECLASGYNVYRGAQNFVHCNMGWGKSSNVKQANGWYQSGIFDTNNRTFARSIAPKDFSNNLRVICDIHPNN